MGLVMKNSSILAICKFYIVCMLLRITCVWKMLYSLLYTGIIDFRKLAPKWQDILF